jgi:hypothetical protein
MFTPQRDWNRIERIEFNTYAKLTIPYSTLSRLHGIPRIGTPTTVLNKAELKELAVQIDTLQTNYDRLLYTSISLQDRVTRLEAENEFMINLINKNLNTNAMP